MDLYDDLDGPDVACNDVSQVSKPNVIKRADQDESLVLARRQVSHYKQQNAQLLRKCTMLEKNLSCLYKTAWAHVRRKDDYIETLKGQIKDFRRLTGMVAPGVPLDGDSADAMDAVEDPAVGSKRQLQTHNSSTGQVSPHHQQTKRIRNSSHKNTETSTPDELCAVVKAGGSGCPVVPTGQTSAPDHRSSVSYAYDRVANSQQRRRPVGGDDATAPQYHGGSAASEPTAHPAPNPSCVRRSTAPASCSHGTTSGRVRPCSDHDHRARGAHGSRRSRSRTPPAGHRRHETRSVPVHNDLRTKNSHRPLQSLPAGDLRRRSSQDLRTSRGASPRHRG